ncbi:DUF2190 family protein [Hydrogenimonas urashimensis]|uniref:DUF2190 family protein n=1 Tax=Hydrogenimonas urashimensis TaxID=2740515 RepID=UPI0019165B10|nr:DUF2190 family protein [Hydrogenimonas urashimensis]
MAKQAVEIQEGKTIDYDLAADTNVGDIVELGDGMVGIATVSGVSGETIALKIEGVYEIAAATADAIAVGDELYFDATNGVVTKTSTDNTRAGRAVSAKAASTTGSVYVKINAA